jgi:hypothetical protein
MMTGGNTCTGATGVLRAIWGALNDGGGSAAIIGRDCGRGVHPINTKRPTSGNAYILAIRCLAQMSALRGNGPARRSTCTDPAADCRIHAIVTPM